MTLEQVYAAIGGDYKGVCQNLGFDALYVPSSALTEALRGGSLDGADELFPPVEKEYQRVVEALKALE